MKKARSPIAGLRREQIVDAAVAVIAEQGIQNLSLSEIESKVDMSRGQLTYYFKTKEEIFLAIFDRLLAMMCQQHENPESAPSFASMNWLEVMRCLILMVLQEPPLHPEFHALQYTFLSQMSHRADFRQRLANLYEEWRSRSAADLKRELEQRPAVRKISLRAMATLTQAIVHGLAMQKAADPQAIDTQEMVHLCLDMLGTYLWIPVVASNRATAKPAARRKPPQKRSAPFRTRLIGEGPSHE